MSAKSLPPVLLVEDSPHDVEFARRAFARCGLPHPILVAEAGEQAWGLLSDEGGHGGEQPPLRPALVLLDLNIPGLDGKQLLRRIKEDARLCAIPTVVLTTSSHPSDIQACYRAGANSYHRKPAELAHYERTISCIAEYWLRSPARPLCGAPADTAMGDAQFEASGVTRA